MMRPVHLSHEITYRATPGEVYAMLADETFRRRSAVAQGVLTADVSIVPGGRAGEGLSVRIDQLQLHRQRRLQLQWARPAPAAHRGQLFLCVLTQLLRRTFQRCVHGHAYLCAQLVTTQREQLGRLPGEQCSGNHCHQCHHQQGDDHRHATLTDTRNRPHPG